MRVLLPPSEAPFDDGSVRGGWFREEDTGAGHLVCELCPRECHLKPGDRGFCFVRENRDGEMALTTYGRSTGFCIDPIEKKPLNHFFPGTSVLSFGTAGCNLGCRFCQNWDISKSREVERLSETATPQTIAAAAKELDCHSVAFTYNDPVIWAEYAIDVARACREVDVKSVAVTAGYIMPDARAPFFHAMDAANVDLKAFTEDFYFQLTASHIQPVLDTLIWLRRESDVWFEITNLIIPDANDSADELRRMCDWIYHELGGDVPVHFSAFHPDFRMQDRGHTPHETLLRARTLAREAGIKHAYVGNVDDAQNQSTYCHSCGELLIQRNWYALGQYHLSVDKEGGPAACTHCGETILGRFQSQPGDWGRRREAVAIQRYAPVVQIDRAPSPSTLPSQGTAPPNDSQQRNAPMTTKPTAKATTALRFNDEQQQSLHVATVELMRAAICNVQPQLSDPTLAGASEQTIDGIFTTIKRKGALRGCCGTLGQPMKLLDALRNAAARTAIDDPRMPPLTLRELPLLELDISILHSFATMPSDAAARRSAIEIGRHGLRIQRGQQAGLLLPVVPVEHQWDVDTFLRQLCRKAGLPTNAWEDPSTQLIAFEANVSETTTDQFVTLDGPKSRPFLSAEELQQLKQHAHQNVVAHLTGATPSYYLMGCPDGTVQGVGLIVRMPEVDPIVLTQFSSRPGVPLQATLQTMTQSAAQRIVATSTELQRMSIDVAVFTETAMHGAMASADLRGINPAEHAVLVLEQGKLGWANDPDATAAELVNQAAQRANVKMTEAAQVFSAACASSATAPVQGGTAPSAADVPSVRAAAVAGAFYPGDPAAMNRILDELFRESETPEAMSGVMVPHAGWKYSGQIAANVLKRTTIPSQVIVIGPKHTRAGVEWAVAPHSAWQIPGGQVDGNRELAERLASIVPG